LLFFLFAMPVIIQHCLTLWYDFGTISGNIMVQNLLRKHIDAALASWTAGKQIAAPPAYQLTEPPKGIGGDFACNAALLLARQLKLNPRDVAEELSGLIASRLSEYVESVSIAGAGFINMRLSFKFILSRLEDILAREDDFGRGDTGAGRKVLIEFVSANPTGPLHIGHGRGAAIGDSLARIFSFAGFSVTREYYLNDTGNQIGMLAKSVSARYGQLRGENVEFPEDGYKGAYISAIAAAARAQEEKAGALPELGAFAVEQILSGIKKDLAAFGVSFDNWFSETGIAVKKSGAPPQTFVETMCGRLLEQGFAYEKDGALWFASSRYGDDKDRVLKRSDGRYTYLASDIAYHKNKLERGFELLINLWGADHHGYVPRMKAAIQALGAPPETLNIILYQLVSLSRAGKPVSMSTRSGEFVTLEEVLSEVGRDACRFFFMLRAPDSPLEFDLELAKKQSSDNPVFYVQYVHARSHSIFREAESKGLKLSGERQFSLLTTAEERALLKRLILFADTIDLCLKTSSPHHMTAYLMELADTYHRFYEKCRVLTDDPQLSAARLGLVRAVTIVIKNGLSLLGVSAPEKM